jgi:PKD repeat protein
LPHSPGHDWGFTALTVQFTENRPFPDVVAWDFGDSSTSTQRILANLQLRGNYKVSLTVTNAGGSETETKNGFINVTPHLLPGANFTARSRLLRSLEVQVIDSRKGFP